MDIGTRRHEGTKAWRHEGEECDEGMREVRRRCAGGWCFSRDMDVWRCELPISNFRLAMEVVDILYSGAFCSRCAERPRPP